MSSVLKSYLQDPHRQQEIEDATRKFLKNRARKLQPGFWTRLARATGDSQQNAGEGVTDELLDVAVSEMWVQILDHEDEAEALLVQTLCDVRNGDCSIGDLWDKLFAKAFAWLDNDVREQARNASAWSRYRKNVLGILRKSGSFTMDTQVDRQGRYGPKTLTRESPVFGAEPGDRFSDIPVPGDTGRKELFKNDKLSGEAVVSLATYFWQAVIAARCLGMPHFVPLNALVNWMSDNYGLNDPLQVQPVRDKDDDEADRGPLDNLRSDFGSPEQEQVVEEVFILARDFARNLPDREQIYCARRYGEEVRLEDLARELGYSSPSGLSRLDKKLMTRLRGFMLQQEEFADEEDGGGDLRQLFLDAVVDECKKLAMAPKGEAGGN